MGETVRHTHKIDDAQFAAFIEAISAPLAPPADTVPARTPYDLGLEPWTFHDPSQKVDVMAYIDDRNQVRHVPTTRTSEVPKAWRRVWIEPRG
jgi:hypothetical protein